MKKPIRSFPPFHVKFAERIAGLDISSPSSVLLAQRLAEDGHTKVPPTKIEEISAQLINKMREVQVAETQFVGQVLPLLQHADAGLQAQIDDYRISGDLDKEQQLDDIGAEVAGTGSVMDTVIAAGALGHKNGLDTTA